MLKKVLQGLLVVGALTPLMLLLLRIRHWFMYESYWHPANYYYFHWPSMLRLAFIWCLVELLLVVFFWRIAFKSRFFDAALKWKSILIAALVGYTGTFVLGLFLNAFPVKEVLPSIFIGALMLPVSKLLDKAFRYKKV